MAQMGSLVVDVRGIPELIWGLRREMAEVLREAADAEADPRVMHRLLVIAQAFETGQRSDDT